MSAADRAAHAARDLAAFHEADVVEAPDGFEGAEFKVYADPRETDPPGIARPSQAASAAPEMPEPIVRTAEEWIAALDDGRMPEQPVLVAGAVRERDKVLLPGPMGAGKTHLLTSLGICLAAGHGFLIDQDGSQPLLRVVESRRCLGWYPDGDPTQYVVRLKAQYERRKYPETWGRFSPIYPTGPFRDLTRSKGFSYLCREIEKSKSEVLLVDGLQYCAGELDLEKSQDLRRFFELVVNALCDRFPLTFVATSHFNKGGDNKNGDPTKRIAGSHQLLDSVDVALALMYASDKSGNVDLTKRHMVHVKPRSMKRMPSAILSEPDAAGYFSVIDVQDGAAKGAKGRSFSESQLIAALSPVDTLRDIRYLSDTLGVCDKTVRDLWLEYAHKNKRLRSTQPKRAGPMFYVLAADQEPTGPTCIGCHEPLPPVNLGPNGQPSTVCESCRNGPRGNG